MSAIPTRFNTHIRKTQRCCAYRGKNVGTIILLWISQINCLEFQDLSTEVQTHDLYLTLITFLFAYMYDSRTTQHDPTPESAWTICNLTPSFTALDPPLSSHYIGGRHVFSKGELQKTLVPSYRRSLAFPLYRSFLLAEKCRRDVASVLQKGKRTVMRCLLEMKYILDHHDVYYIYNKMWLDDYCVWIQADARWVFFAFFGIICSINGIPSPIVMMYWQFWGRT